MTLPFGLIGKLIGEHEPPVDVSGAKKVLIVDLSYIGDIVMTSVTHRAVRRHLPGAELHLWGLDAVRHILPLLPFVDVLHTAPRTGFLKQVAAAWKLRREDFDVAVHLNTGFLVNFLTWLTGAKIRLGYDYGGRGCLHNVRVPIGTRTVKNAYRREECVSLLRSGFGWEAPAGIPALAADPGAARSIEGKLRDWGVSGEDFLVGIHTNSRQDREIRCWEEGKFAETANALIEKYNAKIVFTDVEADRRLVEPILRRITRPDRIVDAIGRLTLPELYSLLARTDVFLSVNTAPMHLAVDAGTPLVAILGYAPPHIYFPPGDPRFQFAMDQALKSFDPGLIVQTGPSKIREIPVGEVLEKVEYLVREVIRRKT